MGTAKAGWSAARAWRWAVASSEALGGAPSREAQRLSNLALWHGGYFVATGLWPVVDLRSFAAVTGPKPEGWLVKMVGLLAAGIGLTMVRAGRRGVVDENVRSLAIASATSFAAIDFWYVGRRRIAPIYLADAVIELGFVAVWLSARGTPAVTPIIGVSPSAPH